MSNFLSCFMQLKLFVFSFQCFVFHSFSNAMPGETDKSSVYSENGILFQNNKKKITSNDFKINILPQYSPSLIEDLN